LIAYQKLVLACLLWGMTFGGEAQTHEIKGEGVRFQPEIIHARVGDVIAFRKMVPHAVESIDAMWPQGAEVLNSNLGADVDYVIAAEGVYVFRCPQHWRARMVGAIVVDGTEDVPGTVAALLESADSDTLKPAKRLLKRLGALYPRTVESP
jgi:plastocyanin